MRNPNSIQRRLRTAWAFCCLAWSTVAFAQQQPPEPKELKDETAAVEGVAQGLVNVRTSKEGNWQIRVTPNSIVRVDGSAQFDYLKPGMSVKFSGEMDKKGTLAGPITEIEIYTPKGKGDIGIFSPGATAEDKPVRNPAPGMYEFRGKVAAIKDDEMSVTAGGKKITGKVDSGATIKVNVEDVTIAQSGDSVNFTAMYYDPYKADVKQERVGQAEAKIMTITLSKPLEGFKKAAKAPKNASVGKAPKGKAPAEDDTKSVFDK